ncbi:ABC transporter ATP-binding protein [Alkalicoccobacillus murimartini]|uniref:ABC-type nitrate/sulfonate/bicarbonate transport system ATPase subunit n=1 Tax=Alkalicoccobacillus murimartini TaxID=171685 RepID=A0ABT9YIP2_9BACI|nr:ABC transporter ATP-binding protein [Alkalicoccobacillus murimartini]MDQ0207728.1 ABC-type nitrate/sulfonate/bicarbonate transport system ATPase subunit [Alkalicoccobacillus murimartini]
MKLEIKEVGKVFQKGGTFTEVLKPTSIQIDKGTFVSVVGPSGCGKSTLFNIIAGLTKPSSGDVLVDGRSILNQNGQVGYMLQKDLLLPWRSIIHNIILGLEIKGMNKKSAIAQAMPLLERYGLKGFEHHFPAELSGGMRQRAALLRTFLYDAEIMLLDEPFAALDAQTKGQMQSWLLRMWEDVEKTIMFVTHDIDEALFLSDTIYVLSARPGSVKAVLSVELERPRSRDVLLTTEFLEMKRTLFNLLAQEEKEEEQSEGGERKGT